MDINLLPETEVQTLEEYAALLAEKMPRLWKVFDIGNSGTIHMIRSDAPRTYDMLDGDIPLLYHNAELDREPVYGAPENIGSYQLSRYLGGVTLTAEQARALVDAPAEQVKEAVKTAGDMLMYMLAANITDSHGDIQS